MSIETYELLAGKLELSTLNKEDKQAILDSLVGITAHNPVSLEEAKRERLSRQ